ncbi:hypothetical protein Bmyc01_59190 [Bacillus mycoides]|uniref:hypothetical protein n=1 Tax=Bacillus proteolyticus TaxID=2026192 RepID=UPI0024A5B957|nr:hypothetical protein [Bacillus proteolyticus]GLV67250.1 hypothetical protein Bmyc01_59190 [Bacillus mycoides]
MEKRLVPNYMIWFYKSSNATYTFEFKTNTNASTAQYRIYNHSTDGVGYDLGTVRAGTVKYLDGWAAPVVNNIYEITATVDGRSFSIHKGIIKRKYLK